MTYSCAAARTRRRRISSCTAESMSRMLRKAGVAVTFCESRPAVRPEPIARPSDLVSPSCQHHNVSAIACLVVEQATGLPSPGFSAISQRRAS
jgi:hypothetical protein